MPRRPLDRAIVVGGSLAGLAAAAALAPRCGGVTLVERDRLPARPGRRPGTPQAAHVHILLRRGQDELERLLPGLGAELVRDGAEAIDPAADLMWRTPYGWAPRFPTRLSKLACSRDLVEWCVRKRLLERFPHVEVLDGTVASEPVADGGRVVGLRVRSAGGERVLRGDLLVDAAGRGSAAPDWLVALGAGRPEETVVDPHMGYASRLYRRPRPGPEWRALYVQPATPRETRYGVVFPVEGDRWLVSLGGAAGDFPPTDEEGFARFARDLPTPRLADAIRDAEPLSRVAGYRGAANRLRHLERLRRWPPGLVVVGDAVATFTPVYGQGMTVAALGAATLADCVDAGGGQMERRFQSRLAALVKLPWSLATGEDLRFPSTTGAPPGLVGVAARRWADAVVRASLDDPGLRSVFLELQHMLRGPEVLLRPDVVARVGRASLRRALRPARRPGLDARETGWSRT